MHGVNSDSIAIGAGFGRVAGYILAAACGAETTGEKSHGHRGAGFF
jgi:hypothetical protein